MSTTYRYVLPVEQTEWKFDGNTETCFTWEYDEPREALLQLYAKGKKQQWDAAERIDWSLDLDPENPMMLDDRVVHIFGTDLWNRMNEKERRRVRHHLQASTISQFMHGEQGALIATAKIVQTVPELDCEILRRDPGHGRGAPRRGLFAAVAREIRARLSDHPGSQGLARGRAHRQPLGHDLSDDADPDRGSGAGRVPAHPRPGAEPAGGGGQRLCHAGRGAPRRLRPARACATSTRSSAMPSARSGRISSSPRAGTCATGSTSARCGSGSACRSRSACRIVDESETMKIFRSRIFSRIVPTVKDIGLWGPQVQEAFAAMGAIEFAKVDAARPAGERRPRRRRIRCSNAAGSPFRRWVTEAAATGW